MSSVTRGDGSRPPAADRPAAETAGDPAADPAAVPETAPEADAGTDADAEAQSEEQASVDVMRLLSDHVPLTLLADLAQPTGPDSPDILEHEGLPEVAWWESAAEEKH